MTRPRQPRGRRVLVVGASSGIGRALALAAGDGGRPGGAGGPPAGPGRGGGRRRSAAGGGEARAWRCDVTSEADCRQVVADAAAWMGGLDELVVHVGQLAAGPGGRRRRRRCGTRCWPPTWWARPWWSARALEHLRVGDHPVVVVTTHSMGPPWPWLGVYGPPRRPWPSWPGRCGPRSRPPGAVRGGGQHGVVLRRRLGPGRGRAGLRAVGGRRAACATRCSRPTRWPTPSSAPCSTPSAATTICSSPGRGVDPVVAAGHPTATSVGRAPGGRSSPWPCGAARR